MNLPCRRCTQLCVLAGQGGGEGCHCPPPALFRASLLASALSSFCPVQLAQAFWCVLVAGWPAGISEVEQEGASWVGCVWAGGDKTSSSIRRALKSADWMVGRGTDEAYGGTERHSGHRWRDQRDGDEHEHERVWQLHVAIPQLIFDFIYI